MYEASGRQPTVLFAILLKSHLPRNAIICIAAIRNIFLGNNGHAYGPRQTHLKWFGSGARSFVRKKITTRVIFNFLHCLQTAKSKLILECYSFIHWFIKVSSFTRNIYSILIRYCEIILITLSYRIALTVHSIADKLKQATLKFICTCNADKCYTLLLIPLYPPLLCLHRNK